MRELIKKHKFALFLEDKERWVRIHHAPEFTRSMNPVTEEYDYIGDEHPTTELMDYKPSEGVSIKTFKGDEDFELAYELLKNRSIGADAHKNVLTVYLFDSSKVDDKEYYYAEKEDATVVVSEMNATDSSISMDINHNGTPEKGYVEIVDGEPVFTAGDMPEA